MNKILVRLQYLGMIVLLIGLLLKLNDISSSFYIYSAGVIFFIVSRIYIVIKNKQENYRKDFIFLISGFLLVLSAIVMYMELSWWIVPIASAAAIELYMSFRMKT